MVDYIATAGKKDNRRVEYVDDLHEHFEDPCLVENGAYQLPTNTGFSIQMKPATFEEFGFSADSSGNAES